MLDSDLTVLKMSVAFPQGRIGRINLSTSVIFNELVTKVTNRHSKVHMF